MARSRKRAATRAASHTPPSAGDEDHHPLSSSGSPAAYKFPLLPHILLLSLAGLIISIDVISLTKVTTGQAWCDFSHNASCSSVIHSEYSHMLSKTIRDITATYHYYVGNPLLVYTEEEPDERWYDKVANAHLGVLFYALLSLYPTIGLVQHFLANRTPPSFRRTSTTCTAFESTIPPTGSQLFWLFMALGTSFSGLCASLGLAYVLAFVLYQFCVVCVCSFLVNLLLFLCFLRLGCVGVRDFVHCHYYIPTDNNQNSRPHQD
eukprot:GHVS01028255.1.p1 GENE.GHVS01028255.1~~GHVS01028255.1.p1  ORF type:complete len:263 (+),score=22.12 GHVS01028255.1:58-846(+)